MATGTRKKTRQTSKASEEVFQPSFTPVFVGEDGTPKKVAKASRTTPNFGYSRNIAYPNISATRLPFTDTTLGAHGIAIDSRIAISLCVKAYWAYPLLRNTIDVMSELANSKVYLKGGNKTTRAFIGAWLDKIQFWKLKEQFFREWFRSGNVFIYRFDAEYQKDDLSKMTQVYGSLEKNQIPIRYIIMNPEFITVGGNIMFQTPLYYKILTNYELARLRNPVTQDDKEFLASLPPEAQTEIKEGRLPIVPLNIDNLSILFYKAQPYEPMGVPMCFGVLDDIETKLELKRIDLAIARTTDRALLLITAGETPTQFNKSGINHTTLTALQNLFNSESVTRTLVADYTVKASWVLPEIDKILGPEKYKQVDNDIRVGLNAILFDSNEKFANTSLKVQVFVERLKEAREAFRQTFLIPEIKRVCQSINAKTYPEPVFEDSDIRDELQYNKFALAMAQLGLLTPDELFNAIDSGQMPLAEESLEHQKVFKTQKENGLYLPLIAGATQVQVDQLEQTGDFQQQQLDLQSKQMEQDATLQKTQMAHNKQTAQLQITENTKIQKHAIKHGVNTNNGVPSGGSPAAPTGRPQGTGTPQSTKTVSPIGTSKSNEILGHSMTKLKVVTAAASDLNNQIEKLLLKKSKAKKLDDTTKQFAATLTQAIMINESMDKWNECAVEYVKSPKPIDEARAETIDDLCIEHNVDQYVAAILNLTHADEQPNQS